MKRIFLILLIAASPLMAVASEISGDTKLACEAILCLSTGTRPSECSPSLNKYFSIKHKRKPWKTFEMRFDFLSLCPSANSSAPMTNLTRAISRGAGHCDAAGLNRDLSQTRREGSSKDGYDYYYRTLGGMPSYCGVYYDHDYTRIKKPYFTGSSRWSRNRSAGYWTQ